MASTEFDALLNEAVDAVEVAVAEALVASELDEMFEHGRVLGQVGGSTWKRARRDLPRGVYGGVHDVPELGSGQGGLS